LIVLWLNSRKREEQRGVWRSGERRAQCGMATLAVPVVSRAAWPLPSISSSGGAQQDGRLIAQSSSSYSPSGGSVSGLMLRASAHSQPRQVNCDRGHRVACRIASAKLRLVATNWNCLFFMDSWGALVWAIAVACSFGSLSLSLFLSLSPALLNPPCRGRGFA
jgi:hypothetical protein